MLINLPHEIPPFQILEGKVVKLQYLKVALDPPWIPILPQLGPRHLTIQIPQNPIHQTGYIEREQIHHLVDNRRTRIVVHTHELKHTDQLIRIEVMIVEPLIDVIHHLKEVAFEVVVIGEELLAFGQLA